MTLVVFSRIKLDDADAQHMGYLFGKHYTTESDGSLLRASPTTSDIFHQMAPFFTQ
jgi:hypothetical protein